MQAKNIKLTNGAKPANNEPGSSSSVFAATGSNVADIGAPDFGASNFADIAAYDSESDAVALIPLMGLSSNRSPLPPVDDLAMLAALAANPALCRVFEVPPPPPSPDGPAPQPGDSPGPEAEFQPSYSPR